MTCVIVDDEEPARQDLAWFISNFSAIRVVGSFADGREALGYLREHSVDVIFLDINMPRMDGIALSRTLKEMKTRPRIVFVTAHREYAVEAFEIEAFDYLLKPFCEERIVHLLGRLEASEKQTPTSGSIALRKNDSMVVVPVGSIIFCEAWEHELRVVLKQEEFRITSGISDFLKRLPPERFFRCHRSYVINLTRIAEITPWFNQTYLLRMQDAVDKIPVSRRHAPDFRQVMGIK